MLDNILITGITDLECYPPASCTRYCKQCIQNDFLFVPDEKPDIESINEIKVSICVEEFEVFKTILGPKLLLSGVKKIKILYTANNCQQSLHSAHWCIPFCEFILLKNLYYDKCFNAVKDVFIGVENVCMKCFDRRSIDISVLFIICPQFQSDYFDTTKKNPDNCTNKCCSSKQNPYRNNNNYYCR